METGTSEGPRRSDIVPLFLGGARVVAAAIAETAVAERWHLPSVLEDQLVSGLAGHLARGGVWVAADYLDAGPPSGPVDFENAAEYFAVIVGTATPEAHRAGRDRSAAVASVGHEDLVRQLYERIEALEQRLRSIDGSELIAVIGGRVMRLVDYLVTRVVEQVVHLDDLARSTHHEPWPVPVECQDLVIAVGTDIARLRSGRPAVLRALYRTGFADGTLPVL